MSLMRQIGWLLAAVVLLALAGAVGVNLHAARCVAIREIPLEAGFGGYMSARRSRSRTHVYKVYRPIQ